MDIIKAREEDNDIIRSLAEVIWPHTYSKILSAEQLDFMFDMMYSKQAFSEQLLLKNHHFLLAKNDGKYVGFASFELNCRPGVTKIHKLYVLPQTQMGGVGKALVNALQKTAVAHSNRTITLNVNRFNPAVKFYIKTGFTNMGQEDIHIGHGYLMEDYIMQKEL